ncbi:MAG TPA: NAD(P)-dependent oxidoreductase [Geminicoccaceae bacterium]|jgi:nucleoside-diphosphate-sugar epimerase|nr:NAD(P)-dependent oxidoreductase [Geminicoccaceae bacterium]
MDLAHFPVDRASFDGPVLVTGAGGCIGSWTLALLTHAGVPAVAFDLSDDQRRPRLLMTEEDLASTPWITGDIADTEAVTAAVAQHDIRAIIHLAALQVPFCKTDPVAGARANVVGTVNVFEAARGRGLKRLAYASSIAAHSFFPGAPWLATLYGAYKLCDEMIARTYAGDWDVPSIGIRPGVVYGVGRDQGLTSKTTVAILAAAAERPYTVPFSGAVSALHAGEIASAFIKAVSTERDAAHVFDLNGRATTVAEWLDIVRALAPGAQLDIEGEPLPFPADLSDEPIREYLGDYGPVPLVDGIEETFDAFRRLLAAGALSPKAVA